MENQTLNTLRGARDLLVDVGWCQGTMRLYPEEGILPCAYCLLGALSAVAKPGSLLFAASALMDVTGASLLVPWNDAPERTLPQVLAAIDQAIINVDSNRSARS